MRRNDKKILSLMAVAFLLLSQAINAQIQQKTESSANCESMMYKLDSVDIASSFNKDGFVIVVAYLGSGEKSRIYNRNRLNTIERYLIGNRGMQKGRLILTEGERRKGLAKIELYVDGKLNNELFVRKKGSICSFGAG